MKDAFNGSVNLLRLSLSVTYIVQIPGGLLACDKINCWLGEIYVCRLVIDISLGAGNIFFTSRTVPLGYEILKSHVIFIS